MEVAREEEKPRGMSDIFGSSQGKGLSKASTDRQLARDIKGSPANVKGIIPLFGGNETGQTTIKMERGAREVKTQEGKSGGSPGLSQLFGKQGESGNGKGEKIALQSKPASEPAKGGQGGVGKGKGISDLFGEKGGEKGAGVASVQPVKKLTENMVQITGQLSKRGKKKTFLPIYPAWAEKEGIEADVAIHFTVSSQDKVVDAYIERTSGHKELDKLAMIALRNWVFIPLPEDTTQENQWGIITFKFRL